MSDRSELRGWIRWMPGWLMKLVAGAILTITLPLLLGRGLKHGFLEWHEQWHIEMGRIKVILHDEADQ